MGAQPLMNEVLPVFGPDITDEAASEILQQIAIPPCPAIVLELLKEARQDEVDFTRISRMVTGDVALAASVLKTANSPFFALRRKATSVQQAVAVLGLRNLLKIIYGVVLKQSLNSAEAQEMAHFWDSSNYNAVVSAYLAARLSSISTDEAYTFGLFHDAGMAILMQKFPDYKQTVLLANAASSGVIAVEDLRHGTNHVTIGALLARNWYLPENVVWAIRYHHEFSIFTTPRQHSTPEVCALVAIRLISQHIVASFLNYPDEAEWEASKEAALAHLGWFEDDVEDMALAMGKDLKEIQADRG